MLKEIPKAYESGLYEDEIYKKWEESGFFNPDNMVGTVGKYCNVLPPPNANGELHIGHTSGYVVMDLFGRYQRMLGKKVLLLPGKDHAGIQTQVVYEKKLKKEQGLSRYDVGREKFYKDVYDFCIDRSQYMRSQEKKMGLSADWSREKFTLDPKIIKTVLETFIQMYNEVDEKGQRMIYRGERIINWCSRCFTALADVEVEHEEQDAKLYTLKYDADFPIAISTSRPETKLGDTAVAVNPQDPRYQKYIGQTLEANFVGVPLKLKIIADENVDSNFGTGAIGVTPAHSLIDWDMAQKNNLEIIRVIDQRGKINAGKTAFQKFENLTVQEARAEIVEELREKGLLIKEEIYKNNLSVCERCKTAIEPLISEQWFINVDHANFSLKKEARKAIENGDIKIHPDRFDKIMLNWIDNVRDWCISRQIWWGPRIPVWYKIGEEMKASIESPGEGWVQDEDTFDTWFSSGQWAYTTLGYPDDADFKEFFPSETMIMGRDILPFWAFRMIILGLYRTKQAPFKNLYFTGLVRDEKGQKMSKSKGNGMEPLEIINKYGTDAVRLSLVIGSAPGNDTNLGEARIAGYRNFVNKLWNISRYIFSTYDLQISHTELNRGKFTEFDEWIVSKMQSLIQEVTADFDNYRFSLAGEKLHDFAWNDLADWYLEVCKFEKNENKAEILSYLLSNILKMLHPFIPFVTEKIWSELSDGLLMVEKWPTCAEASVGKPSCSEVSAELEIAELVKEIVVAIRNVRSENKIEPARKVKAVIYAGSRVESIKSQEILIRSLRTGIDELEILEAGPKFENAILAIVPGVEIYLIGAVDEEKERARLLKRKEELEKLISSLEMKLSNQEFLEKAPAVLVEKEKGKLAEFRREMGEIVV